MDFQRFVKISKIDREQQMVWGYASTPALDLDDEKVSLAAIKAALPGYLEWSNIREMHQPSAVGVAREASVDEKGLWLGAHITDPTAWQKCVDRVYKGFSIGGHVTKKSGKIIEGLELIEISVVDRPANPECRIEIVKAARPVLGGEAELVPAGSEDDAASAVGRAVGKAMQVLGLSKVVRDRERGEDFEKSAHDPKTPGDGLSHPAVHDGKIPDVSGNPMEGGLPDHPHAGKERGELPGVATDLPNPHVASNDAPRNPFESHLEPLGKDATDADKKPYGDVEYADPGHQPDGRHRYPIDTAEHVRAAWSYVHQEKNASKYSPEQLAEVRSRIAAAWKDKIGGDGPPSAEKMAKMADPTSDFWDLRKGMYDLHRLVGAFDRLREVQRIRMLEGKLEGDDENDAEAASRAGSLAQQVAALIADIAGHEGDEAATMTDVDDLQFLRSMQYQIDNAPVGAYEMSAESTDLAKRASAAMRDHLTKAVMHLGKAADCHKSAMSACKALGSTMKDAAMAAKAVALDKAASPPDMSACMEHLHKMHGALSAMEDHHDLAMHHAMKCAGAGVGEGNGPDWDGMGPSSAAVPRDGLQVPADGPAAGKGAFLSREVVDEMVALAAKAAKAEGALEALQRSPAGSPRGRTFEIGKAAQGVPAETAGRKPLEMLLEGVDTSADDIDSRARAAGKMIGNMIKNAGVFAKNPITDPNFRGLAG